MDKNKIEEEQNREKIVKKKKGIILDSLLSLKLLI